MKCATAARRWPSLLIDNEHAVAIARFLRVDSALRLDFCSNVTGVDWPDRVVKKTTKVKKLVEGQERRSSRSLRRKFRVFGDGVFTLYSMTHKHGPVIIRMRTSDRADGTRAFTHADLAERGIQEREIFDL